MKIYAFFAALLVFAPSAPAFSQNRDAEFDRLLGENFQPDGPGAAVLVAQKGKIIYHKAVGLANLELEVPLRTDHVFRIGSVSKQFTAAAILQLMEQGKLSLDDELTKFIPDYPVRGKKITVEHLLTHTSGIKSYTDMKEWTPDVHRMDFTPVALIDFFKNQPMDFDPGTQYNYSNSGYVLLGYIIEKVSGKTYAEYIEEHIFKPLGMRHSYYGDTYALIKNRAAGYSQTGTNGAYANSAFLSMTQPYAAGSLMSTVEDLYTWTKALHGGKVVKPETLKKATTPFILPDGANTRYGYGLQTGNLLGSPTVQHGGGIHGFLSDLLYLPEEDVCVAILTNCDCKSPGELSARMAAVAIGKDFAPNAIAIDPAKLEQYTGVYENDKKEQRVISSENGQLYSQRSGGSKFRIIPYAEDRFFFEGSFARIAFQRENGSQKISGAVVSDRTADAHQWVKTDKATPAAKQEIQLTESELDKFTGVYELAPTFSITVAREGKQLYCQATNQPRFEVFAESPTRFFLKVVEAAIEFYPDENGVVQKMVLFQSGREMEGKRIK